MDHDCNPYESPDESLADAAPHPLEESKAANITLGTVMLGAAGVGALVLLGVSMLPAVGATRSAQLQWEERQRQIEEAEQDAQSNHSLLAQDAPDCGAAQ